MGCWMSNPKRKSSNNNTFDGEYVAVTPPTRGLSKRLLKSRNSYASSSGVSSGCNTPLRESKAYSSRCNSPSSPMKTPPKHSCHPPCSRKELIYENLPLFLRNVPLDIECDDVERKDQLAVELNVSRESGGYYSEESTEHSSSLPKGMINTQSSNQDMDNSMVSECDLEMEMHMMGKAFGIMPKTSSPVQQRRDLTFEILKNYNKPPPPPSSSYLKWRKYLQMTPTYALHNITDIPEAIAGRFCPPEHPAYSDIRALQHEVPYRNPYKELTENIAETIIMELPVPTITTEL